MALWTPTSGPIQEFVAYDRKGPTERLDHSIDWRPILVPIQDSIVDVECDFTIFGDLNTPSDMFVDGVDFEPHFTAAATTAFAIDGTAGKRYICGHTILTSEGRIFRLSALIDCVLK